MLLLDYWKTIPGFESHQASYSGKIRHRGKIVMKGRYNFTWVAEGEIKETDNGAGYLKAYLFEHGYENYEYVHILVALTFIPNPNNLPEVNHMNFVKSDNRACNLEWCTRKQNMEHASKMGRMKGRKNKNPPIQLSTEG